VANRAVKTALFDEFARAAKALASGRRIELLDVLANGERTVEALAGAVGLSVANTSQHLQVLRQAGLVTSRREGTSVHYRLAAPEVFQLWQALWTLAASRRAEIERLAELPRDREIVAYCRGPFCAFAHEAVALLTDAGFTARRLEDGLPEWAASGLPVAGPR
jgi:DNA-binding transcriptional ArsR family regulator